jgi:hypothetical protein
MADSKETAVFAADVAALSDSQIKELQDKFGLKLQVRARADALAKVLGRIGEVAVQNFDRTNPGYERSFDRTADLGDPFSRIINPVDLEDRISGLADRLMRERVGK